MKNLTRIGMDTSKSVFQLHGVDASEQPVLRKKLRRGQVTGFFAKLPATKVAMEACGGAHHWARELTALGHEVMLLPAQYVKPYVGRNKNDAADAAAICEAMSRPMVQKRCVAVKTAEQQACLMLVGIRDRLIAQRTQLSNSIRGYAAEFGLVTAKGLGNIEPLLMRIAEDKSVPLLAKEMFAVLAGEFASVNMRLRKLEAQLMAWHRHNELSRRLADIPGIGPLGATLLVMKVADPSAFRSGRDFAAWLGLTPKDHSTAGRRRLGGITRAGDEALRKVLIVGAMAVIQQASKREGYSPWLMGLIRRKPAKLAAVALANKTARIVWKLMVSGECYDPKHAVLTAAPRGRPARHAVENIGAPANVGA